MERRIQFDDNPTQFCEQWSPEGAQLSERILTAQQRSRKVKVERAILVRIASACAKLGVDGHRGDIVTLKTAKAYAAYNGRDEVQLEDIGIAATLALPHRVRRTPFDGVMTEVTAEILRACSGDF